MDVSGFALKHQCKTNVKTNIKTSAVTYCVAVRTETFFQSIFYHVAVSLCMFK